MTLAANLAALARRLVGTAANNLVALDANGKLPAVDGSQITGIGRRYSATQALTGLSAIDFTGIPASANRVVVGLDAAATPNGYISIILGTGSGFVTTGYVGSIASRGGETALSEGFKLGITAGASFSGYVALERIYGNVWAAVMCLSGAGAVPQFGSGRVVLGSALTSLRLSASAAMSGGNCAISWS